MIKTADLDATAQAAAASCSPEAGQVLAGGPRLKLDSRGLQNCQYMNTEIQIDIYIYIRINMYIHVCMYVVPYSYYGCSTMYLKYTPK